MRDALEAMSRGDVEPAVSLLDPEVEWRGPTRVPLVEAYAKLSRARIGAARVTSAHHNEEECN
jgi:hypothetical protein